MSTWESDLAEWCRNENNLNLSLSEKLKSIADIIKEELNISSIEHFNVCYRNRIKPILISSLNEADKEIYSRKIARINPKMQNEEDIKQRNQKNNVSSKISRWKKSLLNEMGLGNDTSIDSEKPEKESFFSTPLHVALQQLLSKYKNGMIIEKKNPNLTYEDKIEITNRYEDIQGFIHDFISKCEDFDESTIDKYYKKDSSFMVTNPLNETNESTIFLEDEPYDSSCCAGCGQELFDTEIDSDIYKDSYIHTKNSSFYCSLCYSNELFAEPRSNLFCEKCNKDILDGYSIRHEEVVYCKVCYENHI
jgi:hypothetical protein